MGVNYSSQSNLFKADRRSKDLVDPSEFRDTKNNFRNNPKNK